MSNIRAITGSSKIVYRNQGGGSKKQGIPSSTNLNMWSHVAFRNRNVVCPCHRHHVFCMNQLGGIGAGGVPGNSYMFAPGADGINKNKILCNINHKKLSYYKIKKLLLDFESYDIQIYIINKEYYLGNIYINSQGPENNSLVNLVNRLQVNNINLDNIQNFVGKKYLFINKENKSLLLQIENTRKVNLNNSGARIKILHNDILGVKNQDYSINYYFNRLYEIE